jgi:hypothetical protein
MSIQQFISSWYAGLQHQVLTTPQLADLRPFLPATPEQVADMMVGRDLHTRAMVAISEETSTSLSTQMINGIDQFVRQDLRVPATPRASEPAVIKAARAITTTGHVTLPGIDPGRVAEMRAHFEANTVAVTDADGATRDISVDEARSGDSNLAGYDAATILACPHLYEIASDPEIVSVVERHLGTAPLVLGFTAWWSFADRDQALGAQLYHRDLADYRFCKLFIYLTDVDADAGPHVFVEGTHDPDTVAEARRNAPDGEASFHDWYFGQLRKSDEDVERYFAKTPVRFEGPAGSLFLVNTQGMHKGLLPKTTERLVCQVLYGVSPMRQSGMSSLRLGTPEASHIADWVMATPSLDYLNRMFLLR